MTDRLQEIRERHDAIIPDNPEADFIARSPEDIGYLLKRLEAAEEHIEALQQLCMWENRGQALQGTVDARALAATTLACWEGNQ